jgi:hypothetical protein
MAVKAKLKVVLHANDIEVAETEDQSLWQEVLAAIQSDASHLPSRRYPAQEEEDDGKRDRPKGTSSAGPAIDEFAQCLGIKKDVLVGALRPTKDGPLLHLDESYWETFKKNTGTRGPGAHPPIVVAATALALWFKYGKLGKPTKTQAHVVLATINLRDKNPGRSFKNCEWLQVKGEHININPAKLSMAITLTRAFCQQKKPCWDND